MPVQPKIDELCPHGGERLTAYLDGELPEDQRLGIECHLEDCPTCRQEFGELRLAAAALRALLAPGVAPAAPTDVDRAELQRRVLAGIASTAEVPDALVERGGALTHETANPRPIRMLGLLVPLLAAAAGLLVMVLVNVDSTGPGAVPESASPGVASGPSDEPLSRFSAEEKDSWGGATEDTKAIAAADGSGLPTELRALKEESQGDGKSVRLAEVEEKLQELELLADDLEAAKKGGSAAEFALLEDGGAPGPAGSEATDKLLDKRAKAPAARKAGLAGDERAGGRARNEDVERVRAEADADDEGPGVPASEAAGSEKLGAEPGQSANRAGPEGEGKQLPARELEGGALAGGEPRGGGDGTSDEGEHLPEATRERRALELGEEPAPRFGAAGPRSSGAAMPRLASDDPGAPATDAVAGIKGDPGRGLAAQVTGTRSAVDRSDAAAANLFTSYYRETTDLEELTGDLFAFSGGAMFRMQVAENAGLALANSATYDLESLDALAPERGDRDDSAIGDPADREEEAGGRYGGRRGAGRKEPTAGAMANGHEVSADVHTFALRVASDRVESLRELLASRSAAPPQIGWDRDSLSLTLESLQVEEGVLTGSAQDDQRSRTAAKASPPPRAAADAPRPAAPAAPGAAEPVPTPVLLLGGAVPANQGKSGLVTATDHQEGDTFERERSVPAVGGGGAAAEPAPGPVYRWGYLTMFGDDQELAKAETRDRAVLSPDRLQANRRAVSRLREGAVGDGGDVILFVRLAPVSSLGR